MTTSQKRFTLFFNCALCIVHCASSKDYFQQGVKYIIHVSLDDKKHFLKADETISYKNNSPDSLSEIYFHLWPNAYKNDETALADQLAREGDNRFVVAKENEFGYIDGLNFRVDDKTVDWEFLEDTIDVCILHLKKPLLSGVTISITTNFKVKIPSAELSRLGHIDQSYFITQWYPKPAVYDANGWNYFPYLDQGEFYSEFGTFDVYVTLPDNYVVGATGDLVDEDELHWLTEKSKETQAMTSFPKDISFPKSDSLLKTLHYHAENVHDFAWFADKRYHVLKGSVELPESKRMMTTWALFTNAEAVQWLKANDYAKDALTYFSKWVGEYPYKQFTCVDVTDASGDGMEYPMLTAIGTYGDAFELEATIQHEIGHSWFYGILGSNERMHPWMDEGMTQFLETRYTYAKYAGDSAKQMENTGIFGRGTKVKYNHRKLEYLKYWHGARANTDQQPDLNAEYFSRLNYSADVYRKTALSFDYLKCYLGETLFDSCMHAYFDQWKFKHPMPNDLKKVFEKKSEKKLDWLFVDLLQSTKKIDYKISSAEKSGGGYSVRVKNVGDISSPVSLSPMKKGNVLSTEWYDGFKGAKEFKVNCTDCDAIKIDGEERIPEPRRRNNTIRTSGIFRKIEKLKIQIPVGEEDPTRSQIYLAPAIGWNNYNKWMFGAAIHNLTLVEKRFEYALSPMYSLGTKNIAGGGRLSYNIYVNSDYINKITISTGYSTYAYEHYSRYVDTTKQNFDKTFSFRKLSSTATLSLLNRKINPDEYSFISIRHVYVEYDKADSTLLYPKPNSNGIYNIESKKYHLNSYSLLYKFGNQITYHPYDFNVMLGQTLNLVLASIEYNQTISFNKKGRGFEFRVFAGFNGELEDIKYSSSGKFDARFHMNGQGGNDDYLFDEVFMGRSETKGILSQQFTATQGGFKIATGGLVGQASIWLASLNIKVPFPGKLPFYLFADAGAFDKSKVNSLKNETDFMYDAGIELRLIPKVCSVYFPFLYSPNVKYVYDEFPDKFDNYWKKIRFELNISKLNPFTLRDQIRF